MKDLSVWRAMDSRASFRKDKGANGLREEE